MVLKHVAHDARFLVVPSAGFDADVLRCSDLDVVDPLPIPQRLEDRVREPEHEHVLDGLFPEVVVDAKDLMLGEEAEHELVQSRRRLEVAAKWLFDHDAHPRSFARIFAPRRQAGR